MLGNVILDYRVRPRLSELVAEALPTARISFGVDEPPCGAESFALRGAQMFRQPGAPAVAALLTNDAPTVELLLGAILAGAEVVSIPLPGRGVDPKAYSDFVRSVCRSTGVDRLVARDDVSAMLAGTDVEVVAHSKLGSVNLAGPRPAGFGVVQFSSGSTSSPKGVRLSDDLLGTNVQAILKSVAPRPNDAAVSWLPLSHDMGLIGMFMSAIVAFGPGWTDGGELALLKPESFLRRPSAWLECLDRKRGTFTAAPDFGYRLAVSRRPPRTLDLTPLRCAIVGGEIIRAATMAAAQDVFGAMGMVPEALCPAYGLAELGLAATMTPPSERWRRRDVDAAALAEERAVPVGSDSLPLSLVASGLPLEGYEVESAGGAEDIAPLRVRAPLFGDDVRSGRPFAEPHSSFETGDLGFVDEGHVYVVGRIDDYLVAGGRNIYAPAIEEAVSSVAGVRQGRVTAVGLPDGTWMIAVELASKEPLSRAEHDRLRIAVRRATTHSSGSAPDAVAVLEHGCLPLTSSGKLQRHLVRKRWLEGTLTQATEV